MAFREIGTGVEEADGVHTDLAFTMTRKLELSLRLTDPLRVALVKATADSICSKQ